MLLERLTYKQTCCKEEGGLHSLLGKRLVKYWKKAVWLENSMPLEQLNKMEQKEKETQPWPQVPFWSLTHHCSTLPTPRLPLESPFGESGFFKLQVTETQSKLTWAVKGSYWIASKSGCSWLHGWLEPGDKGHWGSLSYLLTWVSFISLQQTDLFHRRPGSNVSSSSLGVPTCTLPKFATREEGGGLLLVPVWLTLSEASAFLGLGHSSPRRQGAMRSRMWEEHLPYRCEMCMCVMLTCECGKV